METINSKSIVETCPILTALLDANRDFLLVANGTTNHCPMALIALARMGASEQRLLDFFESWKQHFAIPIAMQNQQIISGEWINYLGDVSAFHALQDYFYTQIRQRDVTSVLCEVIEKNAFTAASGAFHAIIRLAYGLAEKHDGEIAAGLAYLVSAHLPIRLHSISDKDGQPAGQRSHVSSVMQGLSNIAGQTFSQYEGDMITTRMRAAAADPDFIQHCPDLDFYADVLHDLADAALQLYWRSPSFIALHMVTGVSAAGQIIRFLSAQLPRSLGQRLLRQLFDDLWPAFCAAYVVAGAVPLSPGLLPTQSAPLDLTWRECIERAIQSHDEHLIKMTYTCYLENGLCHSPMYLKVVQRLAFDGNV